MSFGEANITLDPNKTYQTISGWEATAQAGQRFADWNTYKSVLMDAAAADGINRFRMELSMRTENTIANSNSAVNDNADPFSINASGFRWGNLNGIDAQAEIVNMMRSRLAARGETPFIVLCYVDFTTSAFEHNANAEEYAELMEATFLHLNSTYGWVPDAVEVILEPDSGENTVEWTATKIANCLLATQRRLAGHGWSPRFIAPSTTKCFDADTWYNNIKAANSSTTQYIDELSYHRYSGCITAELAQNQAVSEADGNRISMLEYIGAGYTHLHTDLKANAVAWQQYALAFDVVNPGDDGSQYYLINHTTHAVTVSSRMKFLRQYFKYIRRGAVRIEAASNNSIVDPVAFRNSNGGFVVVVKTEGGGKFTIQGLPAGTYGISYTTRTEDHSVLPEVTLEAGTALTTSIPTTGVLTAFAR